MMLTVEGQVETNRGARYLAQLCDHLDHMRRGTRDRHRGGHGGHGGRPEVRSVERADDHAEIEFDWGRLELNATTDALAVRASAEDEEALARGQALIGRRIETIGRREHLTVTWRRADRE